MSFIMPGGAAPAARQSRGAEIVNSLADIMVKGGLYDCYC